MVGEYYTGGGRERRARGLSDGIIQAGRPGFVSPGRPALVRTCFPCHPLGFFYAPGRPHTRTPLPRPAASPGLIDATGAPRARGFVNGAGNLGARWITYLLLIN